MTGLAKYSRKFVTAGWMLSLVSRALLSRARAGSQLHGAQFDRYGRLLSFRFLLERDYSRFLHLLCNPVSLVRYFEFDFVLAAADWRRARSWLDVSSPRMILLYILRNYPEVYATVINPDTRDLEETAAFLKVASLLDRSNLAPEDATALPYADDSFDVITSISVIEHIPADGDTLAVREMWRVLKPGGRMVITLPCRKQFLDDWRGNDMYSLGVPEDGGLFFFQRWYDSKALQERIVQPVGVAPLAIRVYGEKEPQTFARYEQRWIENGLQETLNDPLHAVRDYRTYERIEDLPGMGICGLIFEKPRR